MEMALARAMFGIEGTGKAEGLRSIYQNGVVPLQVEPCLFDKVPLVNFCLKVKWHCFTLVMEWQRFTLYKFKIFGI